MAEIGNPQPKPNVGIRGNTQSTPVLERRESLQASTTTPNFTSALTDLALTPTALGELSSKVMQSASIAMAEKQGQELGKNPRGNLLPPITNFDKALSDAYSTQSQVTLGLSAQQMMADAQNEINKLNKLNPNAINNYTASMTKGLQDILSLAPNTVRPQLQNQFASQIISSTSQLNNKLTSQNKADAASQNAVWRTHQVESIGNAVKDGNFDAAKEMYDALQKNIAGSYAAGTLTANEADTAKTGAKISYESAKSIHEAMSTKESGTLEPYLQSIAGKKIPGLSWSESEQVRNNTLSYINQVEAAENRNQSIIVARGQQDIQNGSFADKAAMYKDQLRPLQYEQLMTSYAGHQYKLSKTNLEVNQVVADFRNPEAYAGKSSKIINQVYDAQVAATLNEAQNNGAPIPLEEAQFQVAASMGVVAPKFIDMINKDLQSGNPMLMLKGMEFEARLGAMQGQKTQGVDAKSLAMAEVFKDLLAEESGSPQEAAAKAKDIIFNKSKEVLEMNQQRIAQSMNNMARDAAHVLPAAVKLSGIDDGDKIENPAAFTADVFTTYKGYMQLTNGDEKQSKALTQKAIQKVYGTTYVNGMKQTARIPIEKIIKLEGAEGLIQDDIHQQLIPQLAETKRAYDNGTSEFYWEIAPRISYDDYAAAKLSIKEKGLSDPKYAVNSTTVKKFEKGEPIKIEQVFRNKQRHTYNINVSSSPYAQYSKIEGNIIGGYDIGIKDPETGILSAMHGYFGQTQTLPEYRPDTQKITSRYISVRGIQGDQDYLTGLVNRKDVQEKLLNSRARLYKKIMAGDIQ